MATDLSLDFCPYKGLAPYMEKDRAYFFGRERDQEIIISNLYASNLTVLYGASGVGKSSVLLAGVVPQLRGELRIAVVVFRNWQDVSFVPALKQEVLTAVRESMSRDAGAAAELNIDASLPLDDFLAIAARTLGGPVFLIFDQFEEYFLYHPLVEDSEAFEAEFARTVNRRDVDVNFILSLREDGLSKLDRFQGRIPTLLSNMLRLEHLDRNAARDAITKPLEEYNRVAPNGQSVTIEPVLVEGLLHDLSSVTVASDHAGQGAVSGDGYQPVTAGVSIETPFLQMVLERLWHEEKAVGSRVMRLETFVKLGRAENIAKTHLDKIMEKLTDQERSTAACVLRYLVTPSGSKIAQEPDALVSWAELKEDEVDSILRRLSAADTRILRTVQVPGQPMRYEIFHDVMAQAILDWRTRYEQEQDRLEAEKKIMAERALAQEELARQHKRTKRSRFIAAGLALVAITMIFLAVKAYRAKFTASSRELAAFSTSQLETDPQLSLLLAIEAVKIRPNWKSLDALKTALRESHVSAEMGKVKGGRIAAVSFSPDGKYVVTGSWDHSVRVWDATNGNPVSSLIGSNGQVNGAAFSSDGRYVVAAGSDAKVLVWEGWQTSTPKLIKTITEAKGLMTAAFSPDGKFIVTGGAEGIVRVWEWEKEPLGSNPTAQLDVARAVADASQTPKPTPTPTPESSNPPPPDAAHARLGIYTRTKSSQTPTPSPSPNPSPSATSAAGKAILIFKAAFNPANGDYIVVAGLDRRAALVWNWKKDLGKGNPVSLLGHRFAVYDAEFSSDGKYVVTGSDDATAIVWDLNDTQKPLKKIDLVTIRVRGVAFSPDGKFVAMASYDKLGRLWEWRLGQPKPPAPSGVTTFLGHSDIVICVDYSADGQYIVTGSDDGTARVWRTQVLDKNLDDLSSDDLLKLAESRVCRQMTPEERNKYLDEPLPK
jgi:WD40 repeat protein